MNLRTVSYMQGYIISESYCSNDSNMLE